MFGPFRALLHPFFGTIIRVETEAPFVSLTFDDGPHPEHTPPLLDILAARSARATFFAVGRSAEEHPELVDRMRREGHEMANHSWSHRSFPFLTSAEARPEVLRWRDAFHDGEERPLFRFPWGHQGPREALAVRRSGHTIVGWDVDPGDYLPERTASDLFGALLADVRPGSIVLLHDALQTDWDRSRAATLGAVDRFLGPEGPGYQCVPVSELFEVGRPVRIHAFFRPDRDPMATDGG